MSAIDDVETWLVDLKSRAASSPEPRHPPAPAWDLGTHVVFHVVNGRVAARAADPWRCDDAYGTRCARCTASCGDVLGERGARPCPDCAPMRSLLRRINAAGLEASALRVRGWSATDAFAPSQLQVHADAVGCWLQRAVGGAEIPALVLAGPTGQGKTTLATWLAWHALAAGLPVRWLSWPKALDRLRSAYGDHTGASTPEWRDVLPARGLVVVDDFGRDAATPWARLQAAQLLDALPPEARLVVTTNAPPPEWPGWLGDLAASRLRGRADGGRMVAVIHGPDLRGQ